MTRTTTIPETITLHVPLSRREVWRPEEDGAARGRSATLQGRQHAGTLFHSAIAVH